MRRGRKRRRKRSATTTTTTTTTRKKGDTQREVSWAVEAIMKQWKGGREEGGKGGGGGTGEGIRQRGVILRRGLVQKVGEGVQIIDTNQCICWDQGSVGPSSAPAMRNKSVSYQIHQ